MSMGDFNRLKKKCNWQPKMIIKYCQNKNERHEYYIIEIYLGTRVAKILPFLKKILKGSIKGSKF